MEYRICELWIAFKVDLNEVKLTHKIATKETLSDLEKYIKENGFHIGREINERISINPSQILSVSATLVE